MRQGNVGCAVSVLKGVKDNMKRLLSLMMVVLLVITSLPLDGIQIKKTSKAYGATSTYEQLKKFRITVDGQVYQADGYKGMDDKLYFTPSIVKQLLGKRISPTTKINGLIYTDLQSACTKLGISSFEYDKVMNAAYIWTTLDNRFSDENRIKDYNLGTASSKSITYKEFFAVLDKAVQIADNAKLAAWKNQFKDNVDANKANVYNSTRTMTRLEGMMAILNLAVVLGPSYSEFNTSWQALNEIIGEKVWDEISYDSKYYDLIPNHYPYNLGGFQKDSYVYKDWDDIGVAYRYGFGRSSLLNGKTLFDYDKTLNSMRPMDSMTVSEALNAVTRFLDSRQLEDKYIDLTNTNALNYDKDYITDALLTQANNMPPVSDNNPPEWYGFVLPDGSYERTDIDENQVDKNFKRVSDWGFNSVRFMLTYQTLFDEGVTKVNETNLKKLDAVIASAIKYKLHLNIVTFSLPGRWTHTDFDTYTSTGSLDLFTNSARQSEANEVWALISERYKNIPSSVLSFCPLWEAQNTSLSSGLPVPPYTVADVGIVYKGLINTIRMHDPDRYVIYEPTANNDATSIINESSEIKASIEKDFTNTLMISNFCECPFVYAEMTAIQGEHIDHNNHSMFKPEYPVTYYATQYHINNGEPLILRGDLVKDTTIDIYLSKVSGAGSLMIKADGEPLPIQVNEGELQSSMELMDADYNVDTPLSRYYLYAQSEKCISVKLPKDVDKLEVSYSGNWFEWSGIDVTLPQRYAVNRWWFMSHYDADKEGVEWQKPFLKSTSRIMLSPNSYDSGRDITINSDISYSTSSIWNQSNQQTVFDWGAVMSQFTPHQLIRFESAAFNVGTIYQSALHYYDDFMAMCKQYQFSWLSNDFNHIFSYSKDTMYAGANGVPYQDGYLLVDMLKVHQKYLPSPIVVNPTSEPEQLDYCTVNVDKASYNYTGSSITPLITVKNGLIPLVLGQDYTIISNNVNVGTATFEIRGINNYTGTITKTFLIIAKQITELTITVPQTVYTYTGTGITPIVTVKYGTNTLSKDKDYSVAYTNNIIPGTAKITLTGKGNYAGSTIITFQIKAKPTSELTITLPQASYTYTGTEIMPAVTVKYGSKLLVKNSDYTIVYNNNVNTGTGKVTINGKGNYGGSVINTFRINPKSISGLKVSGVQSTYSYNGSKITPSVFVMNGTKNLSKNKDYTLTYLNNVNIGSATVTIQGRGNYTGTIKKGYQIKPGTPTLKLTAGSKKATISWSKVKGASGYELYISTSKTGKYSLIKTTNASSYVKKSLISKKTYYIKVRAYTTIKGKKGYGGFSEIKSVKIK